MASMHIGMKSGKPGQAAIHAQYILREGPYRKGDKAKDLVATGHGNLPPGITHPLTMWKAADKGERANAAAYREIIGALPRELTPPQQIEVVEEFISRALPDKPFHYAIHCPRAALGKGTQPHVHLMYSDRIPDGIYREPVQFFGRYNARFPAKGGCKKDSGGKDPATFRDEAKLRRENWAQVQNEYLEKYGHEARLDPRSYRARGLQREVEQHLGAAAIRSMSAAEKRNFIHRTRTKAEIAAQHSRRATGQGPA